jgi:dihydrolipoamide dehydrogenase
MSEKFDLAIIGAGPGGYVCAIKAAQLGLKVAIIEKRKTLGGTCLNVGCIPSKALLHASEMFHEAGHGFEVLGIDGVKPKLNLKSMMAHKDAVVKANVDGVAFLMKKNKITTFVGTGSIKSSGQVEVTDDDGKSTLVEASNIVIATGSDVAGVPGVEIDIDEKAIVSSTGALELAKVPKSMIVVGGGVIGLELGSVWSRLGTEVIVVEFLPVLLGGMDGDVAKQLKRSLAKQGMSFHLSSKVTAVSTIKGGAKVSFEPVKGGDSKELKADIVLVATGRRPYSDGLGLEALGVAMERGKVVTDAHWQTNIKGIYAIGDITDGPMLAHKAEEEGVAVAEMLTGGAGHVNYDVIPGVVYTQPEVASVGKTSEELKADGVKFKSGKFGFIANGRARAMNQTEGFVKVLTDASTDKVLGVHIIGFGAGEMIHEAAVLMVFGGSAEDLARTCHAHPTMSEAVKEAAMAAYAKPIHM